MEAKILEFASPLALTTIISKKEQIPCGFGIVKSNSIVADGRTPRKILEIHVERERV